MSLIRRVRPELRSITSVPWAQGNVSQSGESVTESTALRLSAVWACVTLLADLVSSMPVDVYRAGSFDKLAPTPNGVILRPSNLGFTRREWMQQGMISLLLRGNAYGRVMSRDGLGYPTCVEWLYPESVFVKHVFALDEPEYFVYGFPTPREDILHLRGHLMPGHVEGMSPIAYQAETIGLGLAIQKFGAQWFGEGAHPSAILSTDEKLDAIGAKAMKDRFVAAIRGRREPAVLGAGIKYTPIQVSPEESQFLASQDATVGSIARMYRVPVERIGGSAAGTGSLTYTNRDSRNLDLLSDTVNFWLCKFEDALSDMLPRGQYVKFNVDSLLRSDLATRYAAHQIALDAGFLTVDEVRAIEDMPPMAGMDAMSSPHIRHEIESAIKAAQSGVGKFLTSDEARQFVNTAGADLVVPGPEITPPASSSTGGTDVNAA